MPSSSTRMVPTNPKNTMSVCQSRPLRARRQASIANTAPTRAGTDGSQNSLEPRTLNAYARSSEIVVDDLDGRPAKLPGAIGKPVLPALALEVVHELIRGRLADINASDALQMLSCDLAHG
jgi:hypothetical protein